MCGAGSRPGGRGALCGRARQQQLPYKVGVPPHLSSVGLEMWPVCSDPLIRACRSRLQHARHLGGLTERTDDAQRPAWPVANRLAAAASVGAAGASKVGRARCAVGRVSAMDIICFVNTGTEHILQNHGERKLRLDSGLETYTLHNQTVRTIFLNPPFPPTPLSPEIKFGLVHVRSSENVTFLRGFASVPLSRDLRDGPTLTEAMAALG